MYRVSLSWNPLRVALKAIFRFLVSLLPRGQSKAQIQSAVPAFQESRVQALLISRLLGRTAQHGDGSLRRLDRPAALGCDHHIVAARGHRTDHRLARLG